MSSVPVIVYDSVNSLTDDPGVSSACCDPEPMSVRVVEHYIKGLVGNDYSTARSSSQCTYLFAFLRYVSRLGLRICVAGLLTRSQIL